MKAEKQKAGTGTNKGPRGTRLRSAGSLKSRRTIISLFSTWLVFFVVFSGTALACGADKAMPQTPVGTSEKKQESGGLFPAVDSNGSGYSILVEMDTSVLHRDATQPEVIYAIAHRNSTHEPDRVSGRLDFAFFEGLLPGRKVTDGLAYLLDKEAAIADERDLTEQGIEESGPEDGYLGISLFLHRPLGRFSPYLWIRGGGQPIPSDQGPEPNATYAAGARCGIPFKVTPACALSIDAGYVVGVAQDPADTLHVPSLTASVEVVF